MDKSIISEGKTTNDAIENGLKKLNVSKNMVDIKVLENEEKRSFFSILTPRVVKVQLTLKEGKQEANSSKKERKEIELSIEEQEKAKNNVENFLKEFLDKVQKNAEYSIETSKAGLNVNIESKDLGFLIGYRGETLYAIQTILSSIANKNIKGRVRVILDIAGYKEKRVKTLENLADKVAKTVERTQKSVTLEPMKAYERKIIHARLQNSKKVTTNSIGEEPRRKVVISIKK
jgi:spoIIIJ-associated protein